MKRSSAEEILKHWKADSHFWRMPDEVLADCFGDAFIPLKLRVRMWVAHANLYANNALWDGKEKHAIHYLMKYGIRKMVRSLSARPKKREISYIASARLSGQISAPQHDWKYVK